MFNSVEGIYQNGKIELLETPDLVEGTKVIVTFLPNILRSTYHLVA